MKHYVGLDVSLKEVSICVVDGDGVVAAEGKVSFTNIIHFMYLDGY